MNDTEQIPTEAELVVTDDGQLCRADTGEIIPFEEDPSILKWRHEQYVMYVASGGLIIGDDGELSPMTVTDFAKRVGVNRTTVYDWRGIIPNFQARVAKARREMMAGTRVSQVYKAMYLQAAAGNTIAIDMYLRNFDPNYKSASAKDADTSVRTLAELMLSGINRKHRDSINATAS